MSFVAINKDNSEVICRDKPMKFNEYWGYELIYRLRDGDVTTAQSQAVQCFGCVEIPKGSIKKLIGKDLTWEDEAVELK